MSVGHDWMYTGLLALLENAGGFRTVEDVLRHWSDVDTSEMPYCAMTMGTERVAYLGRSSLAVWTIQPALWIYVHAPDPATLKPRVALSTCIGHVENILREKAGEVAQSMGFPPGRVQHARITGEIETDEGTLGVHGYANLTVEVMGT